MPRIDAVEPDREARAYAKLQIEPLDDGYRGQIITTKAALKRRTERAFLAGWDAAMREVKRKEDEATAAIDANDKAEEQAQQEMRERMDRAMADEAEAAARYGGYE